MSATRCCDFVDRLRGLCGDADAWMGVERQHIGLVEDDIEIVQIFGQAAHLDVAALADDDGMIAVAIAAPRSPDAPCGPADRWLRRRRGRARVRSAIVRSDAPCAVTISVLVATCAGSRTIAISLAWSAARTAGLCTRSPRIVSGPAAARSSAKAIASRTPKHMPRCWARIIRGAISDKNFIL